MEEMVNWILTGLVAILLTIVAYYLKETFSTIKVLSEKMERALVHIARDRSDIDTLISKHKDYDKDLKSLDHRVNNNEKEILKLQK